MKKLIAFFKNHKIISNILLIIITGCLLVWLTFVGLDVYTHHGEKELVPDVKNLSEEMAAQLLEGRGMQYDIVDSVYRRDAPKGCVVDQYPTAGSMVKKGRRIYLTINAKSTQMIALPAAKDMSLRQAKVVLEGAEFVIDKVSLKPSEYKDLVLGVYYNGKEVEEGERLPIGSKLELWVGSGSNKPISETDMATTEGSDVYTETPTETESDYSESGYQEPAQNSSGDTETFEEELVF